MTRNNNGKLRAVFLAALMVLWVFAGTVAFAGGAAAADVSANEGNLNGQDFFQGQELEIDLDSANNDLSGISSMQIRQVTSSNSDGEPVQATTVLTNSTIDSGAAIFDTSSLDAGEEYVVRVQDGSGGNAYLNTSSGLNSSTLNQIANRDGESVAVFTIGSQTMSTAFENDDDESEVRAGESIEFQFESNQRGAPFFVNVSEANGDLDNEDLQEIFFSMDGANLTDATGSTLEDGNAGDDDDEIQIRFESNNFEEDITVGEDIDAGEYELVFEVNDTTAESTADLTVLESADEDGSFDQALYTETRGDIVEISGQVEGTTDDELNLTIGDEEDFGYEANVTVETNDDGEFTVLFNTRNAGLIDTQDNFPQDIDEMTGDVFGTAEDQGEVLRAEQSTDGGSKLASVLVADTYDIELHDVGEDPNNFGDYDVASMDLTERSTDSMTVWRGPLDLEPGDDEIEDLEAIEQAVEDGTLTQTDTVAIGDREDGRSGNADLIVHEIGVSGVQGQGVDADALLNKSANGELSLEYEQSSPATNRDPLELNYTDDGTNFGAFDVILDRENDRVFAIANAEDLRVSRGTQTAAQRLPVDETFEVRYNVSAKYLAEFDRDNDFGDDGFESGDGDTVSQDLDVVDRELSFETLGGDIVVPPTEDAEITGTTTIAPGTEFDIRARGTGDAAFLRTSEDVVVNEDGSFAGVADFSDIEAGTEFDATVRQQGFEDNAEQSGVVQESEGAVFAVSDLSPAEAEAMQGDTITVSATITNDGDTSGTQTVALTIDGNEISTQEVELDAGGETTVEFADVDTSELEEGDHEHAIQTDDDSASGTLTITVEGGDDGAADDGASDDGASDDGASDDGSADDSSGDDGAADDGETEDQPGFGAVIALIALLGAALLAARRNN